MLSLPLAVTSLVFACPVPQTSPRHVRPAPGFRPSPPTLLFEAGFLAHDVGGNLDDALSADLVTSCNFSPFVSVVRGRRRVPVADVVRYGAGDHPSGLALADFDGDGRTDVAVASTASNRVVLLLR